MTAFTTRSEDLAATVLRAARFIPETLPRFAPPVCKGIMLTVGTSGVEITATDTETTGRGRVPAEVAEPGRILVDGAQLARIARHLPAATTTITLDGQHAVITSSPATWRLLTMPAEDFPAELPTGPDLDTVKPVAMDGHQLALVRGEAFVRRIRPRRAARPPRAKEIYSPSGLDVGAWITWTRRTETESQTVRGQVWASAPGAYAVWALVEGEPMPVKVEPRYHRRGTRLDLTTLTEVPAIITAAA